MVVSAIGQPGVYQENVPWIQYSGSGWGQNWGPLALNEVAMTTSKVGDSVSITFDGDVLVLHTFRGPERGRPTVSIDGVSRGQIDLTGPDPHVRDQVAWRGLGPGTHTVVITHAQGIYLDVDGVTVEASPTPPPSILPVNPPTGGTGLTLPDFSKVVAWAQANPMAAAGVAVVAYLMLGGGGRRRRRW